MGLGLLIVLPLLLYWPGLSGGFLLDDLGNLATLVRFGEVRDLESLMRALGNGIAGPLGRPVSLLSFLLNDTGVPDSAAAFKYTNLLLHVLNGVLLFWLLYVLNQAIRLPEQRALVVALLASLLWVLHPLWVSTTLYVVQRMAMLATTFSLAAFILFVKGRVLLAGGQTLPGMVRIGCGLGGFGTLGLLSKENAGLLPLQCLVLEVFLFSAPAYRRRFPQPALYRLFVWVCLILPSVLLLYWLLQRWSYNDAKLLLTRDLSMLDRALTEGRVFFEYIRLIVLPADVTRGLFYDDILPSRGLLTPWTTLLAQIGICIYLALTVWLRKRCAVLALALAFFFVGHLMETWLVALEIAFEHRNYLPALLLFWPLALLLTQQRVIEQLGIRIVSALSIALVLIFSIQTLSRSALWGQPLQLSQAWVRINPTSERAHSYAIETLLQEGRMREAGDQIEQGLAHLPGNAVLALAGLQVACATGEAGAWVERVATSIASDRAIVEHYQKTLDHVLSRIANGSCDAVTVADVLRIAQALAANPRAQVRAADRQRIQFLLARCQLMLGSPGQAMQAFRQALDALPDIGVAIQSAVGMAGAGFPQAGLELLQQWKDQGGLIQLRGTGRSTALKQQRRAFMLNEYERIRAILLQEVAAQSGQAPERVDGTNP